MQDEVSILDAIGGLDAKDNIYIGAALGGLLIWLYWYYNKTDTKKTVNVDATRKHITLGAFPSIIIGALAGSLLGMEIQSRGFDIQSSAIMAGITGIIAPWAVYKLVNHSYDKALAIMGSKYFTDVMPSQTIIYQPQQSGYAKALSGLPPGDGPQIAAQEWQMNRAVVLASLAKIQQEGRLTNQELIGIHQLLPEPADVAYMESQALVLEQRSVELTVGGKLDLQKLILRYKQQADEQQTVIQQQQELIKKHETRYDPQSRIIRDAAFGIAGFVMRTLAGWL